MSDLDLVQRYLDAWNDRDARAIASTFAPGGTYNDPTVDSIPGDAVGEYAARLWSAFPDLTFDIVSIAAAGEGRVVAEWNMRGTNTGAFMGLPPTGRAIAVAGVDVIDVAADGIRAVKGYFDTRAIPVQLGLQVLVQPDTLGPFGFGNAVAVQSGSKAKPGAFGITTIWNESAQTEEVRAMTRETAKDMLKMEGFIGVGFFRIGDRGVTISAWEKPEQVKQLRAGAHSEAMRRFWAEVGYSAFTSVWVPDHINPMWVRCTACGKMNGYELQAGVCKCGQPLAEPPAYF
jgi:steroid delta-isomerase-like uncharacterized protein